VIAFRTLFLLAMGLLLTGCAQHVDLRVTSDPSGASVSYRVGTVGSPGAPGDPRTDWHRVGRSPFDRRVIVPSFWSDPGMTFQLKVEASGHRTEIRTWEPTRIRTDHAHLTTHFVMDRVVPQK